MKVDQEFSEKSHAIDINSPNLENSSPNLE